MFQNIKNCIIRIQENSIVRDTLVTTFFATGGKAVGFLIPFFIAAWYGVGTDTDAFFFAYGLIIFLATIFSPVMESIIVPFIAEKRANQEDVGRFVGNILGISAIGLFTLSILFLVVSKPLLPVLTRFSSEGLRLINILLIESIPLVILLVWTSILAGTLNAYKVFVIPAISPAFRALSTLGFIYVFKEYLGVHAIAWGYVVGEIFRLTILFWLLQRLKYFQLRLSFRWEHKFNEFLQSSSYQLIGMSAMAFTPVINKTMASWLGEGNVSILEFADRLYMIPLTLLSSGFIVTLLSHWSERYQTGGIQQLHRDVSKAAKAGIILGVALTILLLFTKDILATLVYGHGQFPQTQLAMVATIYAIYLLSVVPYLLSQIYCRAFLTQKDTKVVLFIALLKSIGTILFNLMFMRSMGIIGIALATTVVSLIALIVLFYLFERQRR